MGIDYRLLHGITQRRHIVHPEKLVTDARYYRMSQCQSLMPKLDMPTHMAGVVDKVAGRV